MNFGLTEKQINTIICIFKKYSEIEQVILYGSRAKGTFSERSDIDLVLKGNVLNRHIVAKIIMDFDDSDLLFQIDLQNYSDITLPELLTNIDNDGKLFYCKK